MGSFCQVGFPPADHPFKGEQPDGNRPSPAKRCLQRSGNSDWLLVYR